MGNENTGIAVKIDIPYSTSDTCAQALWQARRYFYKNQEQIMKAV